MSEQVVKRYIVPKDMAWDVETHSKAMPHEQLMVMATDYEALRAENGRLKRTAEEGLPRLMQQGYEMRNELEAARGLLEQRIPCDVMLPPATTIKRGCQLSTVLTSMKMREDVPPNQRVFHRAPEVPDHLRDSAKMVEPEVQAEQGERQEAIGRIGQSHGCTVRFPIWNTEDGSEPPAGTMLYTTPQPGPDVRALVHAAKKVITWLDWSAGLPGEDGEYMHVDVQALRSAVERLEQQGEHS